MQRLPIFRLLLLLALVTLLAAGCAKKPTADEAAEQGQVSETQMQEQQVSGIQEQPISESQVGEQVVSATAPAVTGLKRIHFDFDRYVLTAEAQAVLNDNASYLKAQPALQVQIEGHCDERGSDEYNLALGEKRALATKNYLITLGVAADRLSIISYGEEIALDLGHDEAAWAKNRRAEFKVLR